MQDPTTVKAANTTPEPAAPATKPTAVPVAPPEVREVVPLREVLGQISRDSKIEPDEYLVQTITPFGGE